jgi:hypothetical protein
VVHVNNPSYSGGRSQEDHSSRPAQENSLKDRILKTPNPKKDWLNGSSLPSKHEAMSSNPPVLPAYLSIYLFIFI